MLSAKFYPRDEFILSENHKLILPNETRLLLKPRFLYDKSKGEVRYIG